MNESYVKKNGLLYSADLHTVFGVDTSSSDFNGRVPYGAQEIADEAFAGSSFTNISLPDSVKSLPPCLFENMTDLTTVKLPGSIENLAPYLFSGCTALTKVTMPEQLNILEEGLFYGCTSLLEVPFKNGTQEIGENAFAGCTSIKSLVIPNTVSKIGPRAFGDCTSLQSIIFSAKLYDLAEDAFEGCNNIRSIRIDGDNHLFYVSEEDGCLYEKSIEGEDKLRVKIVGVSTETPEFISKNFDDSIPQGDELFISDEDLEEDDTFSSEIDATEDELNFVTDNKNSEESEGVKVTMDNDVDAMFADIMSDEKERSGATADVGISDEESKVLSEMMDVMADSKPAGNTGAVSTDELERLFANSEAEATKDNSEEDSNAIDSKTRILMDSVELSKVIECTPAGEAPEDSDLFVIAEKTVDGDFSAKLVECVNKLARIQDFKRIIMISGLPLDNDEFMQFYFHFINKRNVVLACDAASPSQLSDYCKTICEKSRISLDKNDLLEQRKSAGIKNNTLIKLIIKDIY